MAIPTWVGEFGTFTTFGLAVGSLVWNYFNSRQDASQRKEQNDLRTKYNMIAQIALKAQMFDDVYSIFKIVQNRIDYVDLSRSRQGLYHIADEASVLGMIKHRLTTEDADEICGIIGQLQPFSFDRTSIEDRLNMFPHGPINLLDFRSVQYEDPSKTAAHQRDFDRLAGIHPRLQPLRAKVDELMQKYLTVNEIYKAN